MSFRNSNKEFDTFKEKKNENCYYNVLKELISL